MALDLTAYTPLLSRIQNLHITAPLHLQLLQTSLEQLTIHIGSLDARTGTIPYLPHLTHLEVRCHCRHRERAVEVCPLADLGLLPSMTLLRVDGVLPWQDLCDMFIGKSIQVRRLILWGIWDEAQNLSRLLSRCSTSLMHLTLNVGIDGCVSATLPCLKKLDLNTPFHLSEDFWLDLRCPHLEELLCTTDGTHISKILLNLAACCTSSIKCIALRQLDQGYSEFLARAAINVIIRCTDLENWMMEGPIYLTSNDWARLHVAFPHLARSQTSANLAGGRLATLDSVAKLEDSSLL
jgi:hypothetical protein